MTLEATVTATTATEQATQWWTVTRASRELDVSNQTIYRMIHRGQLKASRRGEGKAAQLLLDPADVREAARRRRQIRPVRPQVDTG